MKLYYLEEIDSTNKYAKNNINSIPDETVVYTYNQTAGRGRLNRKWSYIGKDNIYASIVLKPSKKMKEVYSNLTQLLCVVLSQTIAEYGVEPKIKWPNDVKLNGKKISGILAESVTEGIELKGIVLGFGINLNTSPEVLAQIDQPATSLNIETGNHIDKEIFLQSVTNKFFLLYNRFINEGFSLIREEYKRRAEFLGTEVSVSVFDKIYKGIASDITENGALKLIGIDKTEHILLIGDIL